LQRADTDDGGSIIEAEIHLAKRPKLFRQTEPALYGRVSPPEAMKHRMSGDQMSAIVAGGSLPAHKEAEIQAIWPS
ncbi:hypothetical protein, partial [Sinorhizobium medicae]|uniref:hypothetical protein n=1 Tax=Sinorhizobium medicae TaxID=110321 RepID=UPI001AECADCE